ncbi:MAG TPA: peptidoglycan-associated lipoprotein Pal [Candidatus Eisenbacteria bacterium]|jgi:peptidoglycan-associated lipoprotein|nr:peptidoglycan-associated lipoprotein Pal [Candidatus Eisenbacteria bacterium]
MPEVARPFYRAFLLTAFAAAALTVGCGKKPVVSHEPPPAAPPAARPTVTLQANPTTINKGDATTLNWSSTNATQLTISPEVGAVAPEGSTKVTPPESTTYTVTASGPGGTADSTVRVTVGSAPPPPPPATNATLEEMFMKEVQDAYFDLDKADIRSDARAAMAKTADFLRNYPQVKVVVEGHCDERGSTEYNLALGDRRAAAVKQYLVSLGIGADRMSTVSYGKEKPFCTESNEDCWQRNRRGHFVMAK